MKKTAIKFTMAVLAIFLLGGLIFVFTKHFSALQTNMEYAKEFVLKEAYVDLGEDCVIVYERNDSVNKLYWIGCTNSKNTHAIMYTAKQNEYTKEWVINIFSERMGSDADSLFYATHSKKVH